VSNVVDTVSSALAMAESPRSGRLLTGLFAGAAVVDAVAAAKLE
jgi:hypothetical protein